MFVADYLDVGASNFVSHQRSKCDVVSTICVVELHLTV